MNKVKSYLFRIMIAIDQLGNVLLLNGSEDQTISGHVGYKAYITHRKRWLILQYIINKMFWFDVEHCYKSIEWDEV